MNITQLQQQLPQIIFGICAIGALFWAMRYRKSRDLAGWLQELRRNAVRASKNDDFRRAELADAEAEIAKYPVPNPIESIKRRDEAVLQIVPKMLFMIVFGGLFFTYMGLFQPIPEGKSNWELYVGPGILLVAVALIIKLESFRRYYGRIQQINRKYLLQKAGMDPARHQTMTEVLQYYPGVAQLWLEHADQYAVDGRLDDALAAIKKARELAPGNLDFLVVELSFLIRADKISEAEDALKQLEEAPRVESDPRFNLYAAAVFLKRNEVRKAKKSLEEALERDRPFSEGILPRDLSLAEVYALGLKEGLFEASEDEAAEDTASSTGYSEESDETEEEESEDYADEDEDDELEDEAAADDENETTPEKA